MASIAAAVKDKNVEFLLICFQNMAAPQIDWKAVGAATGINSHTAYCRFRNMKIALEKQQGKAAAAGAPDGGDAPASTTPRKGPATPSKTPTTPSKTPTTPNNAGASSRASAKSGVTKPNKTPSKKKTPMNPTLAKVESLLEEDPEIDADTLFRKMIGDDGDDENIV